MKIFLEKLEKITKIFSRKPRIKNKYFVYILFTVIFLCITAPEPTMAAAISAGKLIAVTLISSITSGVVGSLTSTLTTLGFLCIILYILYAFASNIFLFGIGLLENVISGWIKFSYTGFDNPVIYVGWPIVRDIANIGIVLGLIIIGLATALRIKDYEAQKILPKLIIVAILINFSLVFCGIIIDASNIIMNHFLGGILDSESGIVVLASAISSYGDTNYNLDAMVKENNLKITGWISMYFIYFFYTILTGMAILAFAVVLLMRYFVLWLLVILSPIAFICWIFPGSRKIWEQWLNQFAAWAFIGVTFSFFLYLANHIASFFLLYLGNTYPTYIPNEPQEALEIVLIYFVTITIFIWVGFYIGLKTNAMGVGAVTGWFHKNFNPAAVVGWAQKGGQAAGKVVGGIAGKAVGTKLQTRMGGPGSIELERKEEFSSVQKKIDAIDDKEKLKQLATSEPRFKNRQWQMSQASAVKRLIESGDIYDLSETERKRVIERAHQNNYLTEKDIRKKVPDMAHLFKDENGNQRTTKWVMGKLSSEEKFVLHEKTFDDIDVLHGILSESKKTLNRETGKWSRNKRNKLKDQAIKNIRELAQRSVEEKQKRGQNANWATEVHNLKDYFENNPLFA